jgi:hypothetical protein
MSLKSFAKRVKVVMRTRDLTQRRAIAWIMD